MNALNLDFETYSEAKLKDCGTYYYAMHRSTEALMLGWALDDGDPWIWDIAQGEPMPLLLENALKDPTVTIKAFNATFERLILKHCLGINIPPERFQCTMVRLFGLSFSGSLDDMAAQFNLGLQKDPRGRALIMRFSKPQPKNHKVRRWTRENDPEGWEEFKEYCRKDVVVERDLALKAGPYQFRDDEWEMYHLDQKVNDQGVPVDLDLVDAALKINDRAREDLLGKARDLTGLKNPNSNTQLRPWFDLHGLTLSNMQKETIDKELKKADGKLRAVLQLKSRLSKASVTKWNAFNRATCEDGRAHGMFQYMGASRTGRWAGRLVQLQNLARGGNTTKEPWVAADIAVAGGYEAVLPLYGDPTMLLSDMIRSAITAPEGWLLNVSDLSSIESRVLGWIADCPLINNTFAQGKDTYKVFAIDMYNVPYDEVTKEQRTFSKPPVLGGGYMLGWKGLIGYAEGMGVTMTDQQAKDAINVFRTKYVEVTDFWQWCKDAVFYTTKTGKEYDGPHGLKTFAHGEFLFIQLPSGRCLAYYQPEIQFREAPWGEMVENFTFMGKDRYTLKWQRIGAHQGFLTENIVQGIARDILCEWMLRADRAGFNIVGHVHDEIIALEQRDRLEELNALIREPIPWAEGLLLDADGYTAKRYKKD